MRLTAARVWTAALAVCTGSHVSATWSIILVDTRTGEIAVGSATCLTNFDLRAGTPVLIPGVGAATAQSFVDSTGQNRIFIRDRLALGVAPGEIIAQLATFDSGHQTRQYGIVDTLGRAATFSGTSAGAWAGGVTGQFVYTLAGYQATVAYAIQGNLLTGAPVVEAARQAAISTDGDLAARLMAAMQAARAMGGDGRCSCTTGPPTSCGSPPPSFTKSAHIAYMLVARIGDREGSNGIYRVGSSPLDLAAADVTGDDRPDLLVSSFGTSAISIQPNITPGGALFPMFGPLPTSVAAGSGPRGLHVGDVTGDGTPDILVAHSSGASVSVLRGTGGGSFVPAGTVAVGASPRALTVEPFDGAGGPDLASANFSANSVSIRLNDGTGTFAGSLDLPVDSGPVDILAASLLASPALDLAVLCQNASRLVLLQGDGNGGFVQAVSLPTGAGPVALAAADLDADGDTDLIVATGTSASVQIFLNAAGTFVAAPFPLGFAAVDVAASDVDNDGMPDIVAAGSTRVAVLRGDGAGSVASIRVYTFAGAATACTLADLDSDGDQDIALANSGLNSAMTIRNDGPGPRLGLFNDGTGAATGDYFMNFNIAFQSASAPDPVVQLKSLYDRWVMERGGRPDAVWSDVTLVPPHLPAGSGQTAVLTIRLRDHLGQPVVLPGVAVSIAHAPGSAGQSTIGPVTSQGGGLYTATITAGPLPALDRFRITADDGVLAVVLTPDAALSLYPGCYANCDASTSSPVLNVADFTCFLARFAAGEPYANCDASTTPPVLNVADFTCFLQRFAAGCR